MYGFIHNHLIVVIRTDGHPRFHRIRGDQQHFVRRDELKVCLHPRKFSLGDPSVYFSI
jgi:hypothetical protein